MTRTEVESKLLKLKELSETYRSLKKDPENYLTKVDLIFSRFERESPYWFYTNNEIKPKYLNIVLTFLTSIDYFILKIQKKFEENVK